MRAGTRAQRKQQALWRLIRQVSSSADADKHRRCAALLLLQLHKITQNQFERRMRQLYLTDAVLGPRAVAWGLQTMAEMCEPGKDRNFFLCEADKARDDAHRMKKIQKGWDAWGRHPWWVVHDKPEKTLARYNSDSMLEIKDGTLEEYVNRRGGWSHVPSPSGNRPVEQQRHV